MGSLKVAVVGGGIGGLAAAVALRFAGARVDVYEQAPQFGEVGAGVALAPDSMRVLRRLGLAAQVEDRAATLDVVGIRRPDGTVIARPSLGSGGSHLGAYRPDLVAILASALPDGVLHTGHRCVAFEQDERSARVAFDNGVRVEADAVIGADGIHSVLRSQVVEAGPPVFSGRVAYRGVVPAARIPGWPRDEAVLWNGDGRHVLTFPLRAGELRNYVGFVPADEHMRESWSAPGDPAALAAEFAGWDPQLSELLAQVETTFRWGLHDRDPLPRWTRGRLTLLGDAAHAMLPHMGQGANQAIEDGMALAVLLRDRDSADVPEALLRYERLRRDRTAMIQQGSRTNGARLDSGQAANMAMNTAQPGVAAYDIEAEAEARR